MRSRVRSGFTLIEVLIVLAILLVLMSLGIGASLKVKAWVDRGHSEIVLRKVSERLERRHDEILKQAREWSTPPAIFRQAGGSAKRAEVLKVKYLLKWSYPQSYAEVVAGIAESKAVGYSPSGYPFLVALASRLAASGPATPAEQNAACLYSIFDTTFGSSSGEFAPSEISMAVTVPMVVDAWGTPLQFLRNGAPGMPVATMPAASPWDADDPDETLRLDAADPACWWAVNGPWFIATFGYDPNSGYWPRVVISAGADKNFIGIEDNLDSGRMQLRVGHQQ